jgi:hypothetical protein
MFFGFSGFEDSDFLRIWRFGFGICFGAGTVALTVADGVPGIGA